MTKNESKLLSIQGIAKVLSVLFAAFRLLCKRRYNALPLRRHG